MVKRIKKLLILIVIILNILINVVYAGFVQGVQNESGPKPPPSTPPDSTSTQPTTPTSPSGPEVVTINCYESIEGNVWEDLGYTTGEGGTDNQRVHIPIEGVEVILKRNDREITRIRTNDNGDYKFTNLAAGTYSLEFVYGDISNVDKTQEDLIKKILKYNGQDYIAVKTPGGEEYLDSTEIEIKQSGKGCLQLFIALDCSYSMRDTKIKLNGEEKSRLSIAVDSAKALCKSLISSGENIYIGLVFFSGTNYRAVSLTKDTTLLINALDTINSNDWYTANTNIVGALDKTYNSFYNNDEEESNRYLVILSDGMPTSDGNIETYYEDSEEEIYSKLDIISESTRNKLQELLDKKVNIISLITKLEDEEENEFVRNVFSNSGIIFENIEDGYKTINMIKEVLKEYLIAQTDVKQYTTTHNVLQGYEEEERRKEVNKSFEYFNYANTVQFDLVDNYTSNDYAKAEILSEKTYMTVKGPDYEITNVPSPDEIIEKTIDDETGEEKITKIIKYVSATYSNQDLVLAMRPSSLLVTKVTATGLRVMLPNGQEITNQTVECGSNFPLLEYIDNEIAHGTIIQIEYTIMIKNDSSIQCNYLELINHLPENFSYNSKFHLITENGSNEKYDWEQVSLGDLENTYVSKETVDKYKNRESIKLILDNDEKGEEGFYIPPGGEYRIKYVISRMISSNIESFNQKDYNIDAEVLAFKNSENRRTATIISSKNLKKLKSVNPGDSQGEDFSNQSTNQVTILPPTGLEINYIRIIEIILVIITGVLLLYIRIKKKKKSTCKMQCQ